MSNSVYIRPLQVEDALTSYQWRNNSKIWRFTGSRPNREITPEIETGWIKTVLARENERRFAICLRENNRYIGNVFFTDIKDGEAQAHIFIGEIQYWGKNRAFEGGWLALEYGFNELQLKQVYIEMHKNNPGMWGIKKLRWEPVKEYENGFVKYIFTRTMFEKAKADLMSSSAPIVSVCILTYNHEPFIGKCLEGVMMQQTSFPFEVIIGEDCSTDNTRNIIKEFEQRYPGVIKPIYHGKNVGPQRNAYEFCWPRLTGKYIAVCEGDDYWTDPLKLQKQVDFLEQHNDFVMCFHGHRIVTENEDVTREVGINRDIAVYEWKDILNKHVATLSVLFRNCIPSTHGDFGHATYGDIFLFAVLSKYGKIAELGFIGGNYRKHAAGMYSGRSLANKYKGTIQTRKFMKRSPLFNAEQKKAIDKRMWREKKIYAKNLIKHGEYANSIKILFL